MKVYLAQISYDYEGEIALGIYTLPSAAMDSFKEFQSYGDEHQVMEYELDHTASSTFESGRLVYSRKPWHEGDAEREWVQS